MAGPGAKPTPKVLDELMVIADINPNSASNYVKIMFMFAEWGIPAFHAAAEKFIVDAQKQDEPGGKELKQYIQNCCYCKDDDNNNTYKVDGDCKRCMTEGNRALFDRWFKKNNNPLDLKQCDITVIMIILRKLRPNEPWDIEPNDTDKTERGQIAMIKIIRNHIMHRPSPVLVWGDYEWASKGLKNAVGIILGQKTADEMDDFDKIKMTDAGFQAIKDELKKKNDSDQIAVSQYIDVLDQQFRDTVTEVEEKSTGINTAMNEIKHAIRVTNTKAQKCNDKITGIERILNKSSAQPDGAARIEEDLVKAIDSSVKECMEKMNEQTEAFKGDIKKTIDAHCKKLEDSPREDSGMTASGLTDHKISIMDKVCFNYKRLEKCKNEAKTLYRAFDIKKTPWDLGVGIPIKEIYISPKFASYKYTCKAVSEYKDIDIQPLKSNQSSYVMFEGYAGSGKTTLMKKILYDWATGEWKQFPKFKHFEIVLFVQLGRLYQPATLADVLKEQLYPNAKVEPEDIFKMIKSYQKYIVLILDGYNEFKPGYSVEIDQIIKREWLTDLTVFITARPLSIGFLPSSVDVTVLRMKGFDKWKDLVGKYVTSTKQRDEIVARLQDKDITKSPLLLWYFLSLITESNTTEIDLYARVVGKTKSLLFKEFVSDDIKEEEDWETTMQEVINDFAFEDFIRKKKRLFTVEAMNDMHTKHGDDERMDVGLFNCMKVQVSEQPRYTMMFTNPALQDYLSACKLLNRCSEEHDYVEKKMKIYWTTSEPILKAKRILRLASAMKEKFKVSVCNWLWEKYINDVKKDELSLADNVIVTHETEDTSRLLLLYFSCMYQDIKHFGLIEQVFHFIGKNGKSFMINTEERRILGIIAGKNEFDLSKVNSATSATVNLETEDDLHVNFVHVGEEVNVDDYGLLTQYIRTCEHIRYIYLRIKQPFPDTTEEENPLNDAIKSKNDLLYCDATGCHDKDSQSIKDFLQYCFQRTKDTKDTKGAFKFKM